MYSFAVLGDTHFVREASHYKALHGLPGGATELTDLIRNSLFTREVTPRVLEAVKAQKPDFVLHTGDIIPGHCDTPDGQLEEMATGLQMLDRIQAPVYFSFGSHDGIFGIKNDNALKELVLPRLSSQLNQPFGKSYYAFTRGGCRFISLDYNIWDDAQRDFLESELAACPKDLFTIVFGHPPVCAIARPFFTKENYCRDVGALFAKYPVHAYFCGHTHNHAASIHRFGSRFVPQLMSTPLAYPDGEVIPLTDVRPFLPAQEDCRFGWGYLEDCLPGWWQVNVEDDSLVANWYVLNRGVQGSLCIPKNREPEFLQIPRYPTTHGPLPPLETIKMAQLRIAGSSTSKIENLTINGVKVDTDIVPVYFDSRQFVTLPQEILPMLKQENAVSLSLSTGSIGALVLELTLTDGSVRRSSVTNYYTHEVSYSDALPQFFVPMPEGSVSFHVNFT